jgi:HK97 family phage major capsid protein
MPDDNAASAGAIAAQPKQPEAPVTEQPKTAAELEQRRIAAIRGLCKANNVQESVARLWIERNYDFTQVSEEFVKMRQVKDETLQSMPAYLDMPAKEKERYSLLRALRASASNDWSKAGLELEANKQVSKQMNRLPRSDKAFFVPLDIMMRDLKPQRTYITRDMTAAGVSGSQYLVGTDNQPGSFIELLRATSVGLRMGVTRMAGLVGNVTIPKMTAGNTAYWLADETTAITESQPTIGQLPLAPKNVAALTELSHQLMQQSTPDAEQLVLTSIARDIGLAADIGILRGSGSAGQPQGIVGTSGVGSVTGTTISAVGIIEFQSDVATANALMPGSGYVTTPIVAGLLMARPELPSTGTTRMWTGNMMEGNMLGFPAMSSSQMLAGTMLFGNWPSVILAEWGVLEMMTNPYSDFTRGLTAVRGWYTCDVGVRYPAAFSYASTIT